LLKYFISTLNKSAYTARRLVDWASKTGLSISVF